MSKKNLKVNCETCDVRGITKEILEAYKSIKINTENLINSKASTALMADYSVKINATNTFSLPEGQTVATESFNGKCRIIKNMFTAPTYLVVNGYVDIDADAFDGECQLLGITVNGVISYPDNISGSLPPITVNGASEVYPSDCTKLPATAIIDKLFALRAKATRYFSKKRVLMLDRSADIAKLVEKKIVFLTKKAYIVSSLLEDAVNLFDESVAIVEVPDKTVYLPECSEITADTLRRFGGRLLLFNDVKITGLSAEELQMLQSLYVSGTVYADEAAAAHLHTIDLSPETELVVLRGGLISDKGNFLLLKAQLDESSALMVRGCGRVELDAEITPEIIREKLTLSDCGVVICTPKQRPAVELVSTDCGAITCNEDRFDNKEENDSIESGELQDTLVINVVDYRF